MRESTTLRRLRVPAHWRLLSFCFVVAVVAILFEGIATHTVGPSAEPRQALGGPAPVVHGRPILAASGSHLVSTQPSPGRRVALTFDDGPDPRWTPKIAAILRRNHVPATFFVIGSEAARHPDLVRLLVRDGNELGNHTFTHVALANGSGWQRRLQLDLTEATIAGITGHYTRLVRPPYSATPDSVSRQDERELATLAGRVALVVGLAGHQFRSKKRRAPTPDYLPQVVVLVPAYNESVGIERAIRSLTASNYPDFEVIVVDDGSTDGTAEVVARLALER